uniref:Ubiquitin thioesterase OTU n=1 Tax=Nelumbo nucifera TaxID=4432 RepID=A0A822ZTU6_NELNU|nr:TPA_asm: hypothetical protein HUJ06_018599 [Nelumbo nucifera]
MLGVLCLRPKPWTLSALSYAQVAIHHRFTERSISPISCSGVDHWRRHHSSECRLSGIGNGTASIWHAILPSGGRARSDSTLRPAFQYVHKGEGSWNVALDVRPARWLHGSDSAWLLFGVCNCLAPLDCCRESLSAPVDDGACSELENAEIRLNGEDTSLIDYRVTGVLADGRCLFRAVAHGACLKSGEEAPDETRQRELADDLRARVADELLKRRKEIEWFVEGDFDAYVKSIQQPNSWGGEPELLMASHVLRTPISVFMRDRSSGVNMSQVQLKSVRFEFDLS